MTREKMEFDVIIVGAGPAGLSAAIRLAQIAQQQQKPVNIAIIEKAAEVGMHTLSGAALEPRALYELIPEWQKLNAPIHTPATEDVFLWLTKNKSLRLPTPPLLKNQGNYIISLGLFCHWLAECAETLGVSIFPGFAATEIIYENNVVCGIVTGDKGVDKQGKPTERFQAGIALYAKQTFFAEGCRGSLTQTLFARYGLREHCYPQTYGLGVKELWEVPEKVHKPGCIVHSIGWPLDYKTYGGSFIYHLENRLVAIGFVTGLDYENPYLNPYEEFQRFKMHPAIYPLLENGKRVAYGARALNEGGFQSIPKLTFPGGLIIGCAAGFLNISKIKGIHTAMKSGMVAAESTFPLLEQQERQECTDYPRQLKESWLWKELFLARNIRPAMRSGLWTGLAYAAIDTYLLRGRAPWTFSNIADHTRLKPARACKEITYPKHDNRVTFDLMSSVYLANIHHPEDQPCHLKLKNALVPITINLPEYASPESRYCPAGVYEIIYHQENQPALQINSPNCVHCKACDIKDPTQNIVWTPPEGGSGPQYGMM